jgi:acyl-CoA thioesterase I
VSKGDTARSVLRRVGPSGIALTIVAPLTIVLVVYTLLHTPTVPVAAALPAPTVSASAQPAPTPAPASTTIVRRLVAAFLGDSYAAGAGASASPKGWADLVGLHQGWVEKNLSRNLASYSTAGEPGGTSYRSRLGALVATGAQIVVVSGGRNDVGVAATQFRSDVRATLVGIHAGLPEATIIVVSPTWANDPAPARLVAVAAIVQAEAARAGATYLDIGEPLAGQATMVGPDGWHPNDAGHAAIAAAVEKALG